MSVLKAQWNFTSNNLNKTLALEVYQGVDLNMSICAAV